MYEGASAAIAEIDPPTAAASDGGISCPVAATPAIASTLQQATPDKPMIAKRLVPALIAVPSSSGWFTGRASTPQRIAVVTNTAGGITAQSAAITFPEFRFRFLASRTAPFPSSFCHFP